jgi:phosphoribosyl-dephospho-CoA transferase
MRVYEMNVLPIEKQFEIMDLIYQKLPTRVIARRAKVSKSTVEDYKKRGPPVYRKYSKNSPGNPYPTTLQEEIKAARQQFQEILLLDNKLIIERNTAKRDVNDLQKEKEWKDTEIGRLNRENIEKERQRSFIQEKFNDLVSMTKAIGETNTKLTGENKQKDDSIKNLEKKLRQYEIEKVKAKELQKFSDDKIYDLTIERDEYKNKVETLERKHESDWMVNLTVALISFLAGIVVDRKVLPKIKDFILSWGAEYGINTEDYANLFSPVSVVQPEIQYTNSRIPPETTISGTLTCSGVYPNVLGTNLNPESSGSPYQQNDMPHSPLSFITSGVELVTNISGA